MNDRKLYSIVQIDSPDDLIKEVRTILGMISPGVRHPLITRVFNATCGLYRGTFPGYRACNTDYHDLLHTLSTFLAMARLIHGARLAGKLLSNHEMALGLIAALLHDAGYIQEKGDTQGTGAKYTHVHVRRSMDFVERHGDYFGFSGGDVRDMRNIILCSELTADISSIPFSSQEAELLGRLLAISDLNAQISDRSYLEKLLLLYREFKEGQVKGYESHLDLLEKTVGFFDFIVDRFNSVLSKHDLYLRLHFMSRWDINKNLYCVIIKKQRDYLVKILKNPGGDPLKHLKRSGIVNEMREKKMKGSKR